MNKILLSIALLGAFSQTCGMERCAIDPAEKYEVYCVGVRNCPSCLSLTPKIVHKENGVSTYQEPTPTAIEHMNIAHRSLNTYAVVNQERDIIKCLLCGKIDNATAIDKHLCPNFRPLASELEDTI